MESEWVIVTIVALFLLIFAILRAQQFRFFWMVQPRLENELLHLAPRVDNLQTVKRSLDLKFMVHHRPGDRLDKRWGQ